MREDDAGSCGTLLWTQSSQSRELGRPLNLEKDVDFPGVKLARQYINGQTLTLHQYHNVEVLWYNYGVYVTNAEGEPIKELCYLFGEAPPVETLKIAEPRTLSGVTASISHWVPGNYCHILGEHLPLLQALHEAGQLEAVDNILIDTWALRLLEDALKTYEKDVNIIAIKTTDHVKCETLIAFEPVRHPAHWGHETFVRFFDRVRQYVNPAKPHRRLIVTRPVGRRGFTNLSELAEALPDFEVVDLEKPTDLFEQARLFAEAEIVVCGHGAALTNLVFMQPGTGVVEIFNHNYGMASFWALAEIRGLHYCASIDNRGPSPFDASGKGEDMIVDVADVVSCIERIMTVRR